MIELSMIVLKATQDKVLVILQSLSGIVERRHAIRFLGRMPLSPDGDGTSLWAKIFQPGLRLLTRTLRKAAHLSPMQMPERKHSLVLDRPPTFYFGSKVNGRNAP